MNKKHWLETNAHSLKGKTILITGTTSGIGYQSLVMLAETQTKVIVGVRNTNKAKSQIEELKKSYPNFDATIFSLDLTDKNSILEFTNMVKANFPDGIDGLINNAGIFANKKEILPCGYEKHFFVDCLAPIFLSINLLPALEKKADSKIVFVSSLSIKHKTANLSDIDLKTSKNDIKTYANAKLWLTAYATEFSKRLHEKNSKTIVSICHPGITASSLMSSSHGKFGKLTYSFLNFGMKCIFPKTKHAAQDEIFALTAKPTESSWVCPSGAFEVYGKPKTKKIFLNNINCSEIYDKINEILKKI